MSDTTKKRLKFAGKLLFVCLLLGILCWLPGFCRRYADQAAISPLVVMSLFLTVILYHIFERQYSHRVHKTHPEYHPAA